MDWKKLAWCAVLSGASMGLVACGGDDDGPMTGPDDPEDGATQVYVVSTISIPESMGTGATATAAGFNLDGMNSTGEGTSCVEVTPDFISITDPSETGVDNALSQLVSTLSGFVGDLDETLATQIAEGSLLILMEVSDIDSYTNDGSVAVRLYLGSVPGGGAPMLSGAALAPGQTFDGEALGPAVTGSITSGRLRASTPRLELMIDTSDLAFALVIRDAVVGASITENALANGAIGGALTLADLRTIISELGQDPSLVDSIVAPLADLQPSADPTACEALSVGILFSSVDAELSGS